MWGFYPHCIHRDTRICSKLFLWIKYSHRGETHCITQIPMDLPKTLCTVHQRRYSSLYKLNRQQPSNFHFLIEKLDVTDLYIHYLILPQKHTVITNMKMLQTNKNIDIYIYFFHQNRICNSCNLMLILHCTKKQKQKNERKKKFTPQIGEPNQSVIFYNDTVPYWIVAATAAVHCLSLTCGKLIATSIMLLNEFVYPVQFTKMMGEMLQPLSSKLITLSLDNTAKQWWISLSEKVDESRCSLFDNLKTLAIIPC